MKPVLPAALAVILSACAGPPSIEAGADPSNAAAPVPPARYAPVLGGTVDYRPVEPRPWAERNRLVAPKREGQ